MSRTRGAKRIVGQRTLSQPCLASGGLAEHTCACATKNDSLCVREDGSDGEAACR